MKKHSTWRPPAFLPNLDGAKVIGLDTETRDPGIAAGQSPNPHAGYVVGVSLAAEDRTWYLPMRHEGSNMNLNPEVVLTYLNDTLGDSVSNRVIVGANLKYDLEFLEAEGVAVKGALYDVLAAEAVLDEHRRRYSLDDTATRRLGETKRDEDLYEYAAGAFGGKANRKQAANIWRCPPELVGPYAEADAALPIRIKEKQGILLAAEDGLKDALDIEHRMMPMLVAMRLRGVRVDEHEAHRLAEDMGKKKERVLERLRGLNPDAPADVLARLKAEGCQATNTDKKTLARLEREGSETAALVLEARRLGKFVGTTVKGGVLGHARNGRVHTQLHQLVNGYGGTITGRFSSSDPNLQNIPARDEELGPLARGLFLPEEGETWACLDYSQIEYRMLLHYALGPVAEAVREQYRENPALDYHALVAGWAKMARKPAKNLNFGVIYGLGKKAMMEIYGWTAAECEAFLGTYHAQIPYAREMMDATTRAAERRGFIKTILGARCRFPFWEPAGYDTRGTALPKAKALEAYGDGIKRAYGYTALNKLLQGSSAYALKKGMVDVWEGGACDVLGAPLVTVHDELDWSVPPTPQGQEALAEVKRTMEGAVTLRLPLLVDVETGPDWGHLEKVK